MKREKAIYFILLTAIFNAVLRLSPESPITLFRILIPISILLIKSISENLFRKFVKISILFIAISCIQNCLTKQLFYPDIHTISYKHLFGYCIHYISMFIIGALVYCLWLLNKDMFFTKLLNFASRVLKFILLIYIPYILIGNSPENFLVFGNINDLGCIFSSGILVIIFDTSTEKLNKIIYIIVLLFLLLYNDSKLAMFGGVLEICLYLVWYFSAKSPKIKRTIFMFFICIGLFCLFLFFTSSIVINGYSVKEMVMVPFEQIKEGGYFPHSSQSLTFRTNNIIGITEILRTTWGIGVGPGNTSLILKSLIPDPAGDIRQDYVSSHIWWYEIMADIGWLIVLFMIRFYYVQWKSFALMKRCRAQLFSQIFVLAFPLWCMSSSGLYTEFFSIMLISLSIILYNNRFMNKYLL